MLEKADFLVEIGTEELPPKALFSLSQTFTEGVERRLRELDLGYRTARSFATPRRLAVLVEGLDQAQPERRVERKGPALKAAFDAQGRPTGAAVGFARSCGVGVEQLETQEGEKGAWLVFSQVLPGKAALELLPGVVEQALDGLPIPKRMRWGQGVEEFVRPVHWVVMLLGTEVIPCRILGIQADRGTRGHRFHRPGTITLEHPGDYPRRLKEEGMVYADFAERRERVRHEATSAALTLGGQARVEDSLLDEVTALVEWPVAIVGAFEERFLEVPPEPLVKTMQGHQKYFPVFAEDGRLCPNFIAIANIESKDLSQVRAGNERVIRPRFSDAAFFWHQDLKRPLAARRDELAKVVFQDRLGSLYDKTERLAALAGEIAMAVGSDPGLGVRAAQLCKCDLLTQMVVEFPELQGLMGRYYAAAHGEAEETAAAIAEHYQPRFAGDALPRTATGRAVALADKLDTLAGIFAIGQKPTGDKDPFGLRRAALGVLRILIETPLDLDLKALLDSACRALPDGVGQGDTAEQVFDYMMERLRGYYSDQGFAPDLFDAVAAVRPTRPQDFDRRMRAVHRFRGLLEAASLAAANKRIRNILRKAEDVLPEGIDAACLSSSAEQHLLQGVQEYAAITAPLFAQGDYEAGLVRLAELRQRVDSFFDQVMVMTEDAHIRRHRLKLLAELEALFLAAADISRLQ